MKVALVWNGDQNSACTYGKVKGKFDISFLLTFLQKGRSNANFLSKIKSQCEELGVPFFWVKLKTAYPEEYRAVIAELKQDYEIEAVVTNGTESLIEDACNAAGMKIVKP